jgi:predicted ATPase/class 3 adenylate cyclase
MRCEKCGTNNPSTNNFCAKCGNALAKHCTKCQGENPPTSDFCGKCGAPLTNGGGAAVATPSPQGPAPNIRVTPEQPDAPTTLEGERKTVTALFADLKGSTELMAELDPEEARNIVDPALRIMVDAVRRYEGYVVQSTGDGIFALFGAPVAYEDHPQRALYAALQMQQELRDHEQRRAAQEAHALEARIGISTGEVVVRSVETGGRLEYTPIGHTTNLASRLETLAPVGSIAISEDTRRLVEGYFTLNARGPILIKGIGEPVNVYEVTGLGPLRTHFQLSARRGLTKFVGRARELEQMRHALELAMGGRGQVVAAMAEAGTGKSRLFYEFKATVPPVCKLLEAYSVSHGKASAWLPVLEFLRGYFGLQDADDATTRREKVRAVLTALDPALGETLPYLLALLGLQGAPDLLAQMDPQVKRQRTLDAIKSIVVRESLRQPTVVIFEDLHWIDAQTQALLDSLADGIANARVLLLVNYRPEYRHEWANKSYYSQLRLDPLGGADGATMLAALLGTSVELDPLKRLIAERTGGNPFFIEEIVQALFDGGALVRNGAVKVTRALSQLRLPPTVQGILASRIDRQPGEHKQLLQTLAVIGRESPLGLIRQVASNAQVERILADLQAGEFIYAQSVASGVEYVFKHALTQEVAYNSLLIERRKQLHEGAGQALESIFSGQLDDHLGQLAHHYSHSDNLDKAIKYLGRAGQQALQRSAYADAINDLTAAIDLLQKLPDGSGLTQLELPLQLALGQTFIVQKGWAAQEVERAFTRAREICAGQGDPSELFPALFGLYSMYHVRGAFRSARQRAHELLQRAQGAQDSSLMVLGHYAVGLTSLHTGELLLAKKHQDIMLSIYDQERDSHLVSVIGVDARVACLSYASWTLWHLGYSDQAVERSKEAVALARSLSHPNSLASAEGFSVYGYVLRREPHEVLESAERVIAFSAQHGLGAWLLFTPIHRSRAMSQLGRHQEGITQMRQAMAIAHAAGVDIGRSHYLCQFAETCMTPDRLDEALDAVKEALVTAEAQEERDYLPEIHRVKGELLLRQDDSNTAEAENCFRLAIEIARHQSAKSWELRATSSLARLLAKQGRRDEARTMLAHIYNWFTEGFDTADLKDAKALLDELGN